jgi:hypothetical protein
LEAERQRFVSTLDAAIDELRRIRV